MSHTAVPSPQVYARTAGVLYLIIIVFGLFSELYVRADVLAPGLAGETAQRILANEGWFRLSLLADSTVFLCDVALAVLLYQLLKPVSPVLALMAAAFRLTQTAIIGLNLLNQHTALMILKNVSGDALDQAQRDTLALMFMDAHRYGYDLGLLFFGVSSLIIGYLLYRSGFFPRWLGALVGAAGAVYVAGGVILFGLPDHSVAFQPLYIIPLAGELAFCLWLLARGVDAPKWLACTSV